MEGLFKHFKTCVFLFLFQQQSKVWKDEDKTCVFQQQFQSIERLAQGLCISPSIFRIWKVCQITKAKLRGGVNERNKTTANKCVGLFEYIPSTAGAMEAVTYESKEANIDWIFDFRF
jgi:hypothetical protein